MRLGFLFALAVALIPRAASADAASNWADFMRRNGPESIQSGDWRVLANDYRMQIGVASTLAYAVAWRSGSDVGALMLYHYNPAVSPPELPGPGPMTDEYVEVTIHCAERTTSVHHMYLFGDRGMIGTWFDPDAASNAAAYGSDGPIGMAAASAC